eukprot:Sspe_Gene.31400::Locus_15500_Transcript_1_1_Confidence_1.000_Length_1546::g.31400::m.31400
MRTEGAVLLEGTNSGYAKMYDPVKVVVQCLGHTATCHSLPWGIHGVVAVDVTGTTPVAPRESPFLPVLTKLRSIHDVLLYHGRVPLPTGENPPLQLYELLREPSCGINVPTLEGASSFRVSTKRFGKHPFHGADVEMEVGGALHQRYNVPAKMKGWDVCIRCDIYVEQVILGTLLNPTADPLSKRHKLAFTRTVTLKPNVAYTLLALAKVKDRQAILDPFCGSGTILLEALEVWPGVECKGVDRSGVVVKGAQANAKAAGLQDKVAFAQGNARLLHETFGTNTKFDAVVSNFPWGIKTGSTADIRELYRGALNSIWGALRPGGMLACIVLHGVVTVDLLRIHGGWDVLHARIVKTGGKLPTVVVAQRKAEADHIIPNMRIQRSILYRFLNAQKVHETAEEETEEGEGDEKAAPKRKGKSKWTPPAKHTPKRPKQDIQDK